MSSLNKRVLLLAVVGLAVVALAVVPVNAQQCKDSDGDGWTTGPAKKCPRSGDCDDTNPAVNPEATEDCTDGIDNDCDGVVDCSGGTTIRYLLTLEPGIYSPGPDDLLLAECGKRTVEIGCPDGEFNAWFGMNDDYTPCADFQFSLPGSDLEPGGSDAIEIDSCAPDPNRSGLNFYFERTGEEGLYTVQLWMRDVDWNPYYTDRVEVYEVVGTPCESDEFLMHMNVESTPVHSQKGKRLVGTVTFGTLRFVKDTADVYDPCTVCQLPNCRCSCGP